MATKKTTPEKKTTKTAKHIGIVKNDPYLEPYEDAIRGRYEYALSKINQLTDNGKRTLSDFANGHHYYGLHKAKRSLWYMILLTT